MVNHFHVIRNKKGDIDHIETSLSGHDLLSTAQLNKGCAFTREERQTFHLAGLVPFYVETLEHQVSRMYAQYQEHPTPISKNVYLNVLHDYNETLFYKLVSEHLEEMLPIIYTPTVGEAVQKFSLQLRKTRGLYISYDEQNQIDSILENGLPDVDLVVVTDGEAVLGIGDQGIGGIKICNAKLMVYSLCAGINPYRIFPIQLDVGTNNVSLLEDPMYLGCRYKRVTGKNYDDFIDTFVNALTKKFPHIYLHWEDFGRDNARRILTRYREHICTINGDMQSTGTVAMACVLAGCKATQSHLTEQRIVIFGAGTAGVGIADQIADAMQTYGISKEEACDRIWLIDKPGLLTDNLDNLLPFQKPYAKSREQISLWHPGHEGYIGLYEVIKHVEPTILIGCSAIGNAFSEEDIKAMASHVEKPIIMPLSNPTEKSEAKPEDIMKWTKGKAIIATGSPFPEIELNGRMIRIAQSNNALAFPGIGLGAMAAKAKYLSDKMLWAAADALSQCSPIYKDKNAPLLPKLSETLSVSQKIALAVANQAREEGLSQLPENVDFEYAIKMLSWAPKYYPYRRV